MQRLWNKQTIYFDKDLVYKFHLLVESGDSRFLGGVYSYTLSNNCGLVAIMGL